MHMLSFPKNLMNIPIEFVFKNISLDVLRARQYAEIAAVQSGSHVIAT